MFGLIKMALKIQSYGNALIRPQHISIANVRGILGFVKRNHYLKIKLLSQRTKITPERRRKNMLAKKVSVKTLETKKNLKVGDKVKWEVKTRIKGTKPFICQGKVKSLKKSTFGGKKTGMGASVEIISRKFFQVFGNGKKTTFVAVSRLTKV